MVLPPDKHEEVWAAQKPLDFPGFVYGFSRQLGKDNMPAMKEITHKRSEELGGHRNDKVIT